MIHNISRFIAALALLATAQGAWAWSGSGTAESPYQIKSTADLDQLASDVNGGTTYADTYFVLTTDLTYSHTTDWNDASSTENNYTAIGGLYNQQWRRFYGHFDGQGHTISGIRIYKSGDTTAEQDQGLFGRIDGAEVKNVFLADARITANDYSGAIVGYNGGGTIENCHVLSDVTIHAVASGADCHGGVVGYNTSRGTVTGCTSAATISGDVSCEEHGGIVGSSKGTVEDCIYFGNTVEATKKVGAICGDVLDNGTVSNCYYISTTFQGKENHGYTLANDASAIGYKTSGVTIDDARQATSDDFAVSGDTYTIGTAAGWSVMCAALYHNDTYNRFSGKTVRLGADITVTRMAGSGDNPFCGNFDGGGNTLTFTATAADNYCAPFVGVKGGTTADDATTISNLNVVTTITANDYRHMAGLIALQWGHVNVSGCNATVNISSTVGTSNPHDLYPAALVSQSSSSDGGTLTVTGCTATGTISTDGKYAAGLVGIVQGTATITDCISSVTIDSSTSGDGTHGGIVATVTGSGSIEGCVFNGKLTTTNGTGNCAGFIAWGNGTISNSLYAPADLGTGETEVVAGTGDYPSGTFYRGTAPTVTNSYYTRTLGTPQGKATRTVAAATDVTIGAIALTGTATQYTVSGITAYSGGGLQRGETLYYGSGDQLSLTLSNSATPAPRGYQYAYTASAGTLSGSTLTMPDQDVTISAALAAIDWATVNAGTSADPYMIYNKDQLLLLAHRVNGTNGETAVEDGYMRNYFKLGADITFDHPAVEGNDYAENYEAIGGYAGGTDRPFCGTFDGANHTVSGIRIRKTGSDEADDCQALFGLIAPGANIHDVHLTDARITGKYCVGGIAGFNGDGYISGCSVTDSYITAVGEYGTICGENSGFGLSNNYYHGCTVNGTENATNVGCFILGDFADIAANNGALPAYRLDLGANITTPPGTFVGQTEWLDTPPVSPRLAPGNGFTLAGNHYFASGYVFTPGSTLASGAAQGYTPRATLGGQLLDLYTPTGNTDLLAGKAIARLAITADCDGKTLASTQAIYSTGQPVTVAYIKADGTPGEANAIALDGTETSLAAGWYFVGKDISYSHTLNLTGDVTLILKDGCEMKVGESGSEVDGYGIKCYDEANDTYYDLTICGQTAQTGTLSVYTTGQNNYAIGTRHITVNGGNVIAHTDGSGCGIDTKRSGNVTINRGSVSATTTDTGISAWAISAAGNLTINGGNLSAKSNSHAILADGNVAINGGNVNATGGDGGYSGIYSNGTIEINGGNVTASSIYSDGTAITLGWTNPTDRITASSISTYDGTVAVADGQALTDGSGHIYTGTITASELAALAGKTLSGTTEVTLTEDNATQALAAINGMSGIGVTFNRAFTANKPSTICLPFDYTKKEGDGSFYAFTSIEHSGGEYIATMTEPGTTTLTANTPYLYLPSATGNVEFRGTPTTAIAAGSTTSGDWTFQGTYDEVKWDTAPTGIYGFSAQDVSDQGISQGEFVKVGAKVRIRPLRAYLKYKNGTENYSAAPTRGTTADLPDRIIVRLIGSDGNTTAIGTLDTRTGEVEIDTWYDLNGRKLAAKPTHRGIYINNGRKVVIK